MHKSLNIIQFIKFVYLFQLLKSDISPGKQLSPEYVANCAFYNAFISGI